jgi:hypothetical protein
MTPFQYVAPLTSIVIALGITRILIGLGRIFQMRGNIRTYRVHTLWTGNVLLSPVIAFLLSILLLPDSLEVGSELKRRFNQNSHWFFALAAFLFVLFITINLRVLA